MAGAARKEIWGPILWKILHTAAACLGKQKLPMLIKDERQFMINVLVSMEYMLPCLACQKHYRDWRRGHPLEAVTGAEAFQKWLWNLHNLVNRRSKKDAVAFEDLPAIYQDYSPAYFHTQIERLSQVIGNIGEPFRRFRSCLLNLLKLMGRYS
jgi:hypothetical protein